MKTLHKTALLATAAFSALVVMTPAQADVMSGAMVNMTNFVLKGSNGVQLDKANFSFLTYTSSADQSVDLSGFLGLSNTGTGGGINFAPICLGAACNPILPNDTFPKLFSPPTPGNYAAADQLETGAPITGITGFSSPAHIANGSYAGLTAGTVAASSTSNNNLNASVVFKLAQVSGVSASFMVDAYLQAAVTAGELFPGFATASYQMDFTLKDLSTNSNIWTYAPDLFGNGVHTVSLNAPLPFDIQTFENTGGAIAFTSTTAALNNTDLYQLSARINTNADAQRVIPEPGTLGLLGLALLAAGGVSIRRRTTQR